MSAPDDDRRKAQKPAHGAVAEPVVGLEPAHHQVVPGSRPRGVPGRESQSGLGAGRTFARALRRPGARRRPARARRQRATASCATTCGAARTWGSVHAGPLRVRPVAYFSAEFGIHESLPDLLRAAWACWRATTSRARPTSGCRWWRSACSTASRTSASASAATAGSTPSTSARRRSCCPRQPALTPAGKPIVVEVPLSRETLRAQVWEIAVGRNKLFLLDTDVDGNSEENRQLAARLYFGDQRIRIRQELLLGVGGVRALRAAGIHWGGLHLNEGHSAFATLEYTRLLMEQTGADFRTCAQEVAQSTVFTTHTPVDAGHDRFPPELVDDHLEPLRRSLGLSQHEFLGLGPHPPRGSPRGAVHDRAGVQDVALRERRVGAARPHHAQVVAGAVAAPPRGRGAGRPHHQRRARAHLARARDAGALRQAHRRRLARAPGRSAHVGAHRQRPRRRAVGDAPGAQGGAGALRAPARSPSSGAATTTRRIWWRRRRTRSIPRR